jgi:hypothetical protein
MVAIALIEAGAAPEEAVKLVRIARPKAFNFSQLNFLLHYRSKGKNANQGCCITF